MLFHVSIDAADPQGAAAAIAELWGGEALPFPSVYPGSWVALAGDDRGSLIEVYPSGVRLEPGEGDADAIGRHDAAAPRGTSTHAAIATDLPIERVYALARRRGWTAKYRRRGGRFGVVELWIENTTMIEVLTAEMQAEYLETVSIANWRAMLAAGEPQPKAA